MTRSKTISTARKLNKKWGITKHENCYFEHLGVDEITTYVLFLIKTNFFCNITTVTMFTVEKYRK